MPKSPSRIIAFRCLRPEHPIFIELHYVQQCLSNFQAIVIDTAVCILCQTQLLSEKRYAVLEFEYSRDCLVQCSIGHGNLWWRET